MARRPERPTNGLNVPSRRLNRMARLGAMGAGIAGNMLTDGARRLAKGERPKFQDLLLTPANAARASEELARLRGAAMKFGQLVSMDSGDLVPPEFAAALEKLRSSAHKMPPQQLRRVLNANWGRDWLRQFERFDVNPIAAASIGQVHRGLTKDGRDLAIKVQYPGVRDSIESDIDNLSSIISMSGLLPGEVDLSALLAETKIVLKEEADYELESQRLKRFRELLSGSDQFLVPQVHDDLTTKDILAMSFVKGKPIDHLAMAAQDKRDETASMLIDLVLREVFDFHLVQTDPNFANFFYDEQHDKIILLDFGATREVSELLAESYRQLLRAAIQEDWDLALSTGVSMGLINEDPSEDVLTLLRETFELAVIPIQHDGLFDFGASDLVVRLRDKALELRSGGFLHTPPPQTVFIHRKFGGLYLLATKLKARVNIRKLALRYL